MGLIEIEGMEFYAYHGHFKEEQIVGSRFLIDIAIKTDCSRAGNSDKLEDALNYQNVYKLIQDVMKIKSYLLENVAERILNSIFGEFQHAVEHVKVKVSKMNVPIGGQIDRVSVTMERQSDFYPKPG